MTKTGFNVAHAKNGPMRNVPILQTPGFTTATCVLLFKTIELLV